MEAKNATKIKGQWTPGPWKIDLSEKYYRGPVIRRNGVIVCRLLKQAATLSKDDNEFMANARLIAAAPDLLAACETALSFLGQIGYCGGGAAPTSNLARAIARAKGESINGTA